MKDRRLVYISVKTLKKCLFVSRVDFQIRFFFALERKQIVVYLPLSTQFSLFHQTLEYRIINTDTLYCYIRTVYSSKISRILFVMSWLHYRLMSRGHIISVHNKLR